MIIALEGIDNAGKTEIAKRLCKFLNSKGKETFMSKELTTDVGEVIKTGARHGYLRPVAKAFLFAADRQIRLDQLGKIDPEQIVIFDRYLHSAVVYREAEGLDGDWIRELNKHVPPADVAIYIDITPEESLRRNTDVKFNIRYSKKQLTNFRELYLGYVDKGELTLIDGMRNIDAVEGDILAVLKSKGVFDDGSGQGSDISMHQGV